MSRLETGGANPSLEALEKLAKGLGVQMNELFLEL
jgi:transcriptional regulator with XRE-family HTH domain